MNAENVTVRSQVELDQAVARVVAPDAPDQPGRIVVDSPPGQVLRVASTRPVQVRVIGNSRLEAAGRHVSVEANAHAAVFARGAVVFASDNATVDACSGSVVMASGQARVRATAGVDCVAVGAGATIGRDVDAAANRAVWAPPGAVLVASPATDGTCIAYPSEHAPAGFVLTADEGRRLVAAGELTDLSSQATGPAGGTMTAPPGMVFGPHTPWQQVDGSSQPAVVYGKDHCPACTATERELNKVGVPYVKVNLADLDPQEYARVTAGHLQAPVVVPPAGEPWSGYRPTLIGEMPAPTEPGPSL